MWRCAWCFRAADLSHRDVFLSRAFFSQVWQARLLTCHRVSSGTEHSLSSPRNVLNDLDHLWEFFLDYERPCLPLCTLVLLLWLHWRSKLLFLCEVQDKAYAKVPVYPPPPPPYPNPLFLWEVTVCTKICCGTSVRSELGTAPYYMASDSPLCVVFATLQPEMWSRRGLNKDLADDMLSARVPQCPALASLLWLCGWSDRWLKKKNCFANQCCGVNEFHIFKSTCYLVLVFTNT